MDQVLLDSDRIKLTVKLGTISLEGVSARSVVSQDLSLKQSCISGALPL